MPDTATTPPERTDWKQVAEEANQHWWSVLISRSLIIVGVLLVALAESLGKLDAQGWNVNAGWFPVEAHAAAEGFRAFGMMAFIAGVAERIIMAIRDR